MSFTLPSAVAFFAPANSGIVAHLSQDEIGQPRKRPLENLCYGYPGHPTVTRSVWCACGWFGLPGTNASLGKTSGVVGHCESPAPRLPSLAFSANGWLLLHRCHSTFCKLTRHAYYSAGCLAVPGRVRRGPWENDSRTSSLRPALERVGARPSVMTCTSKQRQIVLTRTFAGSDR